MTAGGRTGVVRLVTSTDIARPGSATEMSVSARLEAELADGSRVVVLDDRGWTSGQRWVSTGDDTPEPTDIWTATSVRDIRETARVVVGPDEPVDGMSYAEAEADHRAYLAEILHERGVTVAAAELADLPHDVELSRRLLTRLGVDPDAGRPE